ncbi:epidermal growth factor-like protein 7 isoform X2 [Ptychodera flava]|uniref:epidermal growth factor-like protein 7 isoform X2 n=1 Tax=Ptychodera flava TaxID=63121 RepID=UPI00396AA262
MNTSQQATLYTTLLSIMHVAMVNALVQGGTNVCGGTGFETYPVSYAQRYTTYCGGFIPCTLYRTAYRIEYRLASGVLRCCDGWEEDNGQCIRPVCDPPCQNGGTCVAPNDCNCPAEYEGQICDSDINECSGSHGGCDSICTNTIGSFYCSCPSGYTLNGDGRSCDAVCDPPCQNGGTCVAPNDCNCPAEYEGQICDSDINECSGSHGGCDSICTNTIGSFYCSCPSGYTLNGDGRSCDDKDECLYNNGGCQGSCFNNMGSFTCNCGSGYHLADDNLQCLDAGAEKSDQQPRQL